MTARVQENRTATANTPPANNSLGVGELYVEMNTPLRLWTGVPTTVTASGVRMIIDATAQATANAGAVQKAGDTMSGPLVLSGQPTVSSQAANKAYVDTVGPTMAPVQSVAGRQGAVVLTHNDITDWVATLTTTLTPYALLASPTFTGAPKAPTPVVGDQSTALATTAFVANQIAAGPPAGALVAPSPPVAVPGTLWWNSTDGQLYLRYDDSNSQQWVTAANVEGLANAATKIDVASLAANVGRNLIHNSMFNIAQRGVGPWTTSGYTMDRWYFEVTTDTSSVGQSVANDATRTAIGDEAATYHLGCAFTGNAAAGAYTSMAQPIEDAHRLAGKTVIISFWANNATATKLGVGIQQGFGFAGSPSPVVTMPGQSVTLTGPWSRYSVSFAIPSVAGKTFGTDNRSATYLKFFFSSGATNATAAGNVGVQSGTINIWGVQLEIAQPGQTQPTPLEKPDPELQLRQCQRFYQTGQINLSGYTVANQYVSMVSTYSTTMRAVPTVTPVGMNSSNCYAQTLSTYPNMMVVQYQATATNPTAWYGSYTASADL